MFFETLAYRLRDEDVTVEGGIITLCIYDISTKGNVIEIPDTLHGQVITGIGDYAFHVAGKIAILKLPSKLKTIGEGAFENHALTSLTIPNGVTSIGGRAFYGNALSSINLPSGLEYIGWGAFESNLLTSLFIPNSVKTMEGEAFENNKISVLTFQSGCQLERISDWCFHRNDIKELAIPNSILSIDNWAFHVNENLSKVTFGNSLIKIKKDAFNQCNLSTLNLPGSLVFIGKEAFGNNTNLENFKLPVSPNNYEWYDSNGDKHNEGATVSNIYYSYVAIIPYTLKNEDVIVENGIIVECLFFHDIRNVGSILTIPDRLGGVEIIGIGDGVFDNRGISEVILPAGLQHIGGWAFSYNEIIHLSLPNSVETIEEWSFHRNCINTLTFEATSHLERIGAYSFESNRIINLDFPKSVVQIERSAFEYNNLQNVNFEANSRLLSLGTRAFSSHDQFLNNITLPDPTVNGYADYWVDWDYTQYISNLVVNNFESFYKIPIEYTLSDDDVEVVDGVIISYSPGNPYANILTIPITLDGQEIVGIGDEVFHSLGLIGINFPSTLQIIGNGAFSDNDILAVTIPSSVEEINGGAFYGNNINELLFEENSKLNYIGEWSFTWNNISGELIIPDSVKYIGEWAFPGSDGMTKLTFGINSTLSHLGEYAFAYNRISFELFIPLTLSEIGSYAFVDNDISKIITHEGMVDYGNGAFENNNPTLEIVLHKPPTIPYITHFFWWKDNYGNHYAPGEIITFDADTTNFNNRYKAVVDQFFVVKFIVSDDNNVPLENASIDFFGSTLSTDINGIDSIGPILRGLQNYVVSGVTGCYDFTGIVDVQDDMTVTVTLIRYFNVNINIVDANNNPVSGAGIIINDSTHVSNSTGNAKFNLSDGNYPLVINAPGYQENDTTIIILDADKTITIKLEPVLVNHFPNEGTGAAYTDITNGGSYTINNNSYTRTAYTFTYWNTEIDGTGITYTENESIILGFSDIDLYAIWTPVEYNITYHLDEGSNASGNPATYNIESEINFLPASKTSLYFATWLDADSNRVEKIEIGNTGNIELWAVFTAEPTYYIDYFNLENASHNNHATYTRFDLPFAFTYAIKRGYEFVGWNEDSLLTKPITTIPAGSKTNYNIYAKWGGAIEYIISYEIGGGVNNPINPTSFTIESDRIVFGLPTKTGATFIGWFNDKDLLYEITEIPKGSIGDTTIYAAWDLDTFNIHYVLDGGMNMSANPSEYTIESENILFEPPTRVGTNFLAWYSDKDFINEITEIPKGSMGDTTIYAKWDLDYFDIQYILDGGNNNPANPSKYTIESNDIVFEPPTRVGAIFVAWYNDIDLTNEITEITKGNIGDTTIYAKWELDAFNIQYVLDGGINNQTNPTLYTIESENISFDSPSKTGATFIAWFDDINFTNQVNNLPKGSFGDTILYAKWQLDIYDIQYMLDGGDNNPANPSNYTIETENVLFEPPTKIGAKFVSWYNDKDFLNEITEIPKGSSGDTIIYADWILDTFNIQYELNGGSNHFDNPSRYTIESENIQFEPPTKIAATFISWYSDIEFKNQIINIPQGSYGDATLYAKWQLDSFNIQYVLDGGNNNPVNPSKYTIESEDIVFEPPTKTGATFVSWYNDEDLINEIIDIPQGSYNDTIIYATWILDTFNIQYELEGGVNNLANPIQYTYPLYQIGHRKLLWNIFLCGKLGRL